MLPRPGGNVINNVWHRCWNEALWLDAASHMPSFNQSECIRYFGIALLCYAVLCLWHQWPILLAFYAHKLQLYSCNWLENTPCYDPRVVIYDRKMLIRLATGNKEAKTFMAWGWGERAWAICGQSYKGFTIVNNVSRVVSENCIYYDSRPVNYECKMLVRLATDGNVSLVDSPMDNLIKPLCT